MKINFIYLRIKIKLNLFGNLLFFSDLLFFILIFLVSTILDSVSKELSMIRSYSYCFSLII